MMPFARSLTGLHDVALYLALMLGFLAVLTGGAAPLILAIGFPLGLVAAHFFYRADLASPSQNKWWNALIVVALLATGVEYVLNPLAEIMASGVRFLLVLTLIKLFSRQGRRDELQIYALSFMTMAAASEVNSEFIYGIIFGLYVLTGTFALALFHLKSEATRQPQLGVMRKSPFDRLYVSTLASISLLIFASSLLIFFFFPRIGLGLFADPSRNSLSISGFSENVDVGDHGTIRDNPSVIMRVDFDGEQPADYASYRWRVMTFDTYDGRGWSRQLGESRDSVPHSSSRSYDLGFLFAPALRQIFDDDAAQQVEVQLEPLGTDVLPTLWPTDHVRLGDSDSSPLLNSSKPTLDHDGYGDLRHSLPGNVGLRYELQVQPSPSLDELRRQSGRSLNEEDAQRYLQRPDTDPRLEELATELTEDADSNYEKAEAIGRHFVENFTYTLDLPVISGDDPVAEFVFDHQEGHCEYFATSAAMMLRSVDVPTRLVNGFLGGTWNDVGDYLTVRQGDAHAWVEVYVPELGWVPFEPTPPIESTFLERAGITAAVADTVDAMRQAWVIWFIDYDLDSQLSLVRDIGTSLAPATPETDDSVEEEGDDDTSVGFRALFFWGGWLLLVGATYIRGRTHHRPEHWRYAIGLSVAICVGATWTGWFQSWTALWTTAGASSVFLAGLIPVLRRRSDSPPALREATRLFRKIEHRAARRDVGRRADEGPGEFLRRIGHGVGEAEAAAERFRLLYLDIRFGNHQVGDEEIKQMEAAARSVIKALR